MRHDKLEKEMNLMLLLTENHRYDVDAICDRIGISRRMLYYYLESFRDWGFKVEKSGKIYSLDRESPFSSISSRPSTSRRKRRSPCSLY